MDLKELVTELLSELAKISRTDAVVGVVRDAGKAKVLPLSRVSIGFGTATGEMGGKSQQDGQQGDAAAAGGGAGGAIVVEPRAFVVVGEDGVPHLLALERGKVAVLRRGLEILPAKPAVAEATLAPKTDPAGETALGNSGAPAQLVNRSKDESPS